MKLLKMWTNGSPHEQTPNTYRHALNAMKDISGTALFNEYGAEVEHIFENQHVCGQIATAKNEVLYFLYDYGTIDNELVLKRNGVYISLLKGQLDIKPEYLVTGDYIYNINGDLIFWFISENNDIRILNVDNIPSDLNKLNIFTPYTGHKFSFSESSGGNLKCGAYFFGIKYMVRTDDTASYVPIISNPVYITNSVVRDSTYSGGYINDISTKSINISLTELDSSFSSYELFVIKKINEEYGYESAGIFDYTGTTSTINYNGQFYRLAASSEIISTGVYYYGAKTLKTVEEESTNSTDVLVGNVKTKNIDYQRFANGIQLKCITKKVTNILAHNESSKHFDYNVNNKSFCHFENYAMYIVLHTKYGRSQAFHIPNLILGLVTASHPQLANTGRINNAAYNCTFKTSGGDTLLGGVLTEIDVNSGTAADLATLKSVQANTDARWFQYLDTLVAGDFVSLGSNTYEAPFNYWENENEFYSNNVDSDLWTVVAGQPVDTGVSLRGLKVKHHKFPSLKLCKEVHSDTQYGVTNFDILGVKIDSSTVVIPDELKDIVTGYELAYAKRGDSNITILANTLTYVGSYLNTVPRSQVHTFTGGNWSTSGALTVDEDYIKCAPIDMLRRNINIVPNIIRNEYLLQRQVEVPFIGTNGSDFTVGGQASIDYTADSNSEATSHQAEIRTIDTYNYMPLNSLNNDVYGVYLNEHYAFNVNNYSVDPLDIAQAKTIATFNLGAVSGNPLIASRVFGFLSSIINVKKNVYVNYYNQFLVSTGQVNSLTTVDPIIYGGDVFNTIASHKMYGRHASNDNADPIQGFRINYQYLTQSVDNLIFRAKGIDQYNYFSPVQGLSLELLSRDREPNSYRYLEEYSTINDINPIFPYRPFSNFIEEYPNRILKFTTLGREIREGAYKNLPPNNYYDMPASKGAIVAITFYSGRVFIQMEKSRYVTVNSKTISFDDNQKASIGSQLLFSSTPDEIMSDKFGAIGCQNRTGIATTGYGDLIIDQERKMIFLSSNTILPLSLDLDKDFRELLPFASDAQNPMFEYGLGYSIATDSIYKRIIVTKKDYRFNQSFKEYNAADFPTYLEGDNILRDGVYYEVILTFLFSLSYNSFYIRSVGGGNFLHAIPISFSSTKFTNKSWTISYYNYGELSGWISYHSYKPDFLFNDRIDFFRIENQFKNLDSYIFKHNITTKKGIYDDSNIPQDFSISFSNDDTNGDRRFTSLLWDTKFYLNDIDTLDTFSSVFAFNENKATEVIAVVLFSDVQNYPNNNTRRQKRYFSFNRLKNGLLNIQLPFVSLLNEYTPILSNLGQLPVENATNLTGRYLIAKLSYDNKFISGSQGELQVNEVFINSDVIMR